MSPLFTHMEGRQIAADVLDTAVLPRLLIWDDEVGKHQSLTLKVADVRSMRANVCRPHQSLQFQRWH